MKASVLRQWRKAVVRIKKERIFRLLRVRRFFDILNKLRMQRQRRVRNFYEKTTKLRVLYGLLKRVCVKRKLAQGCRLLQLFVVRQRLTGAFKLILLNHYTCTKQRETEATEEDGLLLQQNYQTLNKYRQPRILDWPQLEQLTQKNRRDKGVSFSQHLRLDSRSTKRQDTQHTSGDLSTTRGTIQQKEPQKKSCATTKQLATQSSASNLSSQRQSKQKHQHKPLKQY